MRKIFKMGDVVECTGNVILVTGGGDRKQGYPVFAGVVIMAEPGSEEDGIWPVGMYSGTWSKDAFKKVNIKLSKIIKIALTQ